MKRIRLVLEGQFEEWVDDDGHRGWQRFVNGEWIVCRHPQIEMGKAKPKPKALPYRHYYAGKDDD